MKVLSFTSLFPNSAQARHGIFVENRLRHLREKYSDVELVVVAPVPWFPFKGDRFGEYGTFAKVPKFEQRYGVDVYHPRYPVIPKIGMNITPFLMAIFLLPFVKKLINKGFEFDVIDAHYFYPDGVAASLLSKWLKKPFVCTARGNDISLIPNYSFPRKLIGKAVSKASYSITVCKALADEILELGYQPQSLNVLRNGVDLKMFHPIEDRQSLRQELNIDGFTLISVGHHIERKGHHLIIDAIKGLPDVTLLLAGDGPMQGQLKKQVQDLGLESRVIFLGAIPHGELVKYYNAADSLVLASSREGWANVLLESMACGTPVVATSIWGTPEIVQSEDAGVLVDRNIASIADGINKIKSQDVDRAATRRYAEKFSWDETSDKLYELLKSCEAQSAKHN